MTKGTKGRRIGKGRAPQRFLNASDAPEGTFPVIDPFSRKLFIPCTAMEDTLAMHRDGVPSLCRLHLQSRCRQGSSCHQAHADPNIVTQLRGSALQEPTCCESHGAKSDTDEVPNNLTIVVVGSTDQEKLLETTPSFITVSKGFHRLLETQGLVDSEKESPVVVVPLDSLCRLHNFRPCCRFGTECEFVHLCRDLVAHTGIAIKSRKDAPKSHVLRTDVRDPNELIKVEASVQPVPMTTMTQSTEQEVCTIGNSPSHHSASAGVMANRHAAGIVSLAVTPKMGTSPFLGCSCNSTSSGILWRHNPYAGSSLSSAVET